MRLHWSALTNHNLGKVQFDSVSLHLAVCKRRPAREDKKATAQKPCSNLPFILVILASINYPLVKLIVSVSVLINKQKSNWEIECLKTYCDLPACTPSQFLIDEAIGKSQPHQSGAGVRDTVNAENTASDPTRFHFPQCWKMSQGHQQKLLDTVVWERDCMNDF